MIRAALLVALIAVAAATEAQAERLTIALSTGAIEISSNFTGLPVTIFGVIEGDDGGVPVATDYSVAVLVLGPRQSVVARRKDRVIGVWANRGSQMIINPPSFYSLNTSGDLNTIATPAVLERLQLGFANIAFAYEARALINDPAAAEFRTAFIRLKQKAGLYNESRDVGFVGHLVFRTTTWLPANIPVGTYTAIAYLFSAGELIARTEEKIEVSKIGFEGTMAAFARGQALAYGLLSVSLALFIGWLGGVIFRRD